MLQCSRCHVPGSESQDDAEDRSLLDDVQDETVIAIIDTKRPVARDGRELVIEKTTLFDRAHHQHSMMVVKFAQGDPYVLQKSE